MMKHPECVLPARAWRTTGSGAARACPERSEGLPLLSQVHAWPLTLVKRFAASYVYVLTSVLVIVCVEAVRLPTTS